MPQVGGSRTECDSVRVLLVGPNVGRRNHSQRDTILAAKYGIEFVTRIKATSVAEFPADVDALVLEYADITDRVLAMVPSIKQRLPDTVIILINGGLTQMQKGWAFYQGVADYFPLPASTSTWELLAARIVNLVRAPRSESCWHH